MNHIFEPYLKKFAFVFFDGIFIYNPTFAEHLNHFKSAFEILKLNHLYVKKSKCTLAHRHVEHLGHIISAEEVNNDPKKVTVMLGWPRLANVEAVRGFLELTRYYRRFV